LVNGRLERRRCFLRAQLVVDADDFKLNTRLVLLAELLGQKLKTLELIGTHRRHQAGQRVQPGDLDGLVKVDCASRCCRRRSRFNRRLRQGHSGVKHGRCSDGQPYMPAKKIGLGMHSFSPENVSNDTQICVVNA